MYTKYAIRTSRKKYRCDDCHHMINAGEKYGYASSTNPDCLRSYEDAKTGKVWTEQVASGRWCTRCFHPNGVFAVMLETKEKELVR